MHINKSFNIILLFSILMLSPGVNGCSFSRCSATFDANAFLNAQGDKIGKSSQIILVKNDSFLFFNRTLLVLMEKKENIWEPVFEPFDAVIGRNGFAGRGEKREGDGKTPLGIYSIKRTFGYGKTIETRMPYRQILADDIWVDDPLANDYNRWTKKGKTQAASYEIMKRDDDLYKYGIVIEYNTNPVIKGNGSAIFLHIWRDKNAPTAGCVAVSEKDLMRILGWLNPDAAPLIITGLKK